MSNVEQEMSNVEVGVVNLAISRWALAPVFAQTGTEPGLTPNGTRFVANSELVLIRGQLYPKADFFRR